MKKIIISILIIILLGVLGLVICINMGKTVMPEYLNDDYKGIEHEKITIAEAVNIVKKFNVTCGVENIDEFADEEGGCLDYAEDYIAYIDNGTPVYMYPSQTCDNDGECKTSSYFDVDKFKFIKNAKQIISKYDQKNNYEFAFELDNGDVYYFASLNDAVNVGGVDYYYHLVKINMPSKLKKFSNVETSDISYTTGIVLELENNEKYVLSYDYETNKATLKKYSDFYNENHKNDDSIELSGDKEIIKLSSEIIKSDKLDGIIKKSKFISNNYDDQEYNGICPEITVEMDDETQRFHVLQISDTKVFLYADNDGSDGRSIEVYGLSDEGLYYAKFFAVDNEDPENHSLTLRMYDIDNIDSIALIEATESNDMLDGSDLDVPYNYVLIKTKNGKYYTDFMYDTDTKTILREVIQK